MAEPRRSFVNVIYAWTDRAGSPMRVGRTSWRRWAGWHRCLGACNARRRAEHRFCEEYLTKGQWAILRSTVNWRARPIHSRRLVPGRITWRLVLGHDRTVVIERATIQALRPRFNVQHGPAQARRLRSV